MEKLHFVETLSVEDFKTQHNVEKIEVKQNPHTGKCFFVYGFESGAVSEKNLKSCHLAGMLSRRWRDVLYAP